MFPHAAPLPTNTTLRERYTLLETLGIGGMGIVYRAQDLLRQRNVALKILHPSPSSEDTQRLLRELALQEELRHPGVVRTYDADIDPQSGALFFTMELVNGPSLEKILQQISQHPPFSLSLISALLRQVVDILEATHQQGILHGDLKPSHLLFQSSPAKSDASNDESMLHKIPLRLIDFGLARPITWSMMPTGGGGTPSVMAPEQWQPDSPLSPATDIYALGMLLYRLLTGAPHVAGQLPPPSLWLQAHTYPHLHVQPFDLVVQTAISYFPHQRYQDVQSFWDAFHQALVSADPQETTGHSHTNIYAQTQTKHTETSAYPSKNNEAPSQRKTHAPPEDKEATFPFAEETEEIDLSGKIVATSLLEQLVHLPKLRSLNLCNTNLRDAQLIYLGGLEQLQSLHLAENPMCGKGLQHLFGLRSLRALSLSQTPLDEKHLEHLQHFPQLRWLSLWRCHLTNKGLAILRNIPSLRTLHLSETPLQDDAFPLLAQFTQLRELALHHTQISLQHRQELQKQLPQCKIRHA